MSSGRRASKGKNVSGMSINSGQDGDWEMVSKKNKNRGGHTDTAASARQQFSQSSAPKAWGQRDTAQRLGIRGTNVSGQSSGDSSQNPSLHSDQAIGYGGRPQAMAAPRTVTPTHALNWIPTSVHSSQVKVAAQVEDEKEKENIPGTVDAKEDDDDDDDDDDAFSEDDDLLSDGFDSDESSCSSSHDNLKNHRMLRPFFEDLDKLTLEEINDSGKQWHCPACQGGRGGIGRYIGLQPLATHAKTKGSRRVKLHRVFAQLLEEDLRRKGTSMVTAGEFFSNWDGLSKETKDHDHEIVWPPMVQIMNTTLEKGDDDKWLGMGNQELLDNFGGYSPVKARHSYGPQGHRGISMLLFESSAVGYLNAERLHKHFSKEGTGREAWEQPHRLFNPGGRRQLYGCLATKYDLENFNRHYQEKQKLKYEMRSYHEMVESQLKEMSEKNQQLTWYMQKAANLKMHSKVLEEAVSLLNETLRKTTEENRILKQRSKMHHEQSQEEMDFQDRFFREQMKQIQEGLNAKGDKFERIQQDKRQKVEELNSHTWSAHDRSRRTEEVERFNESQDQEMSQFVLERDELEKIHEKKKEEMKKRHLEEMLALEKEFDADFTLLMEKYAPGFTREDASSVSEL